MSSWINKIKLLSFTINLPYFYKAKGGCLSRYWIRFLSASCGCIGKMENIRSVAWDVPKPALTMKINFITKLYLLSLYSYLSLYYQLCLLSAKSCDQCLLLAHHLLNAVRGCLQMWRNFAIWSAENSIIKKIIGIIILVVKISSVNKNTK